MKRIIITLLLLVFSLTNAQINEISESDLYEKAEASVTEFNQKLDKTESAAIQATIYQCFSTLVANFPKSENYRIYLYNKGFFQIKK